MIRLILILILSFNQATQASYSEHHEYLNKIIEPASTLAPRLQRVEPAAEPWFEQADKLLNPNELGSYRASFLLSFDDSGYIDALSVKDLAEDDFAKFKEFTARLLSLKFASLPQEIDPNEVFEMDGELLYLDRPCHPEPFRASGSHSGYQGDPDVTASLFLRMTSETQDDIELELIHPSHIDYPVISETIKFKLDDAILETQVLSYDQEFMYLALAKLSQGEQEFYQDTVLRIARPKKNSKTIAATAIGAGLVSAASTGVALSSLSYGIAPAAMGLAGISSDLVRSKQELLSFNLSKGAKVIVERGNKTRGEKQ